MTAKQIGQKFAQWKVLHGIAVFALGVSVTLGFRYDSPSTRLSILERRQATTDSAIVEVRSYVRALARDKCLDDPIRAALLDLSCRTLLNSNGATP